MLFLALIVKGRLKPDDQRRLLAGYYGLRTHLDHQISRPDGPGRVRPCPGQFSSGLSPTMATN